MPAFPKTPLLVIRADASPQIGFGHVMRCMAVAEEWGARSGKVLFLASSLPSEIEALLTKNNFEVQSHGEIAGSPGDVSRTVAIARERAASWTMVDGDRFDAEYLAALLRFGLRVLAVDDNAARQFYGVDAILNPSISARVQDYGERAEGNIPLLVGGEYTLLRSSLLGSRPFPDATPRAGRLLVCLGGSDPVNRTAEVLEALGSLGAAVDSLEVRVLVGAANPFGDSIRETARRLSLKVEIESGKFDVASGLAWADTVIAAAGVFGLEVIHHRLPMGLTTVAANQERNYAAICALGAAVPLGAGSSFGGEDTQAGLLSLLCDPTTRERVFAATAGLVDGEGARRVVDFMLGRN